MKKLLLLLPLTILYGCGDPYTIFPNEIGYEITASGVGEEERLPGTHRLDICGANACPKVLRLETSKSSGEVTIEKVFLPKSNIDLEDVKATLQFRIKNNSTSRKTVIQEVSARTTDDSRQVRITSEDVWKIYLARIVPETIIMGLKEYEIEQTLSDVSTISNAIKTQVNTSLSHTPVEITEFSFSNGIGVVPPEVIRAKRALYAITEEKERTIKAIEAETIVEKKRQTYQQIRVKNDKENAKEAGVPFETYAWLKILERNVDALDVIAASTETASQNKVPFAVGTMSIPNTIPSGK